MKYRSTKDEVLVWVVSIGVLFQFFATLAFLGSGVNLFHHHPLMAERSMDLILGIGLAISLYPSVKGADEFIKKREIE